MPGEYPQALDELAQLLGRLPGVGRRTAERLALALCEWDEATLRDLGDRLSHLRQTIHPCRTCGNLADQDQCRVCADPRRDPTLICVVEHSRQVPVIERCGHFHGVYHVLGGRVSPLDGVELADLSIEPLCARITATGVTEVIVATSPDVEGEATAACVAGVLRERFPIKLSRIALGLPVGSDLTYADPATMALALDSRRSLPG